MNKVLIYKPVSVSQFRDEFRKYNRHENYTYNGLGSLFDYLEERAESCDHPYELDVVELCMEYTEYSTIEDIASDYGVEREDDWDDEEFRKQVESEVEEVGYMWQFEGGFMVEAY